MDLGGIMPSEMSEKGQYSMQRNMWNLKEIKQMNDYNKTETALQIQRRNQQLQVGKGKAERAS